MKKMFYLFLIAMVGLTACGYKLPKENRDEYVIKVAKEGSPEEMIKILKKYPEYKEKMLEMKYDDSDETIEGTVLHYAAVWNTPEMIQAICENGVDVDIQNKTEGYTALDWAVTDEVEKNIIKLLDIGADPSVKDNDGYSLARWRYDAMAAYVWDPDAQMIEPFKNFSEETLTKLDKAIDKFNDGAMTKLAEYIAEIRAEKAK